jgi:hypothetical protein
VIVCPERTNYLALGRLFGSLPSDPGATVATTIFDLPKRQAWGWPDTPARSSQCHTAHACHQFAPELACSITCCSGSPCTGTRKWHFASDWLFNTIWQSDRMHCHPLQRASVLSYR